MLERIESNLDIKKLTVEELVVLCSEIREAIIKRVKEVGGHLGSNLGIVEATVALHYVFDSPTDQFVFDTSHQTYPHKIITGRKEYFLEKEKYRKISGFTTPKESVHDMFKTGHTSSSISLAMGLAKGRDLLGKKNNVVAIIGDGSLSGGQSFEAFNNAGDYKNNFIILVNDNEMSIAENHGGLYKNLQELRETSGKAENNYFKAFGLDYDYLEDGNDIGKLIEFFEKWKNVDHPVVLHIHTLKGSGYKEAIESKEFYHYYVPSSYRRAGGRGPEESIKNHFYELAKKDKRIVGIFAGTPGVFGYDPEFRKELGSQCVDVGIAEQFEISYACGIARNGGRPIVFIHSSFLQRAYDQLNHEMAMNNLPVIILVYGSGVRGGDCTHIGLFDTGLISNIPNIKAFSPYNKEELLNILDKAIEGQTCPVIIKVPDHFSDRKPIMNVNAKVALCPVGQAIDLGYEVYSQLKKEDIECDFIPVTRYDKVDIDFEKKYDLVVTIEDTLLDGAYGEKMDRVFSALDTKVLNFGGKKEFNDLVSTQEIFKQNRYDPDLMVSDIKAILGEKQ